MFAERVINKINKENQENFYFLSDPNFNVDLIEENFDHVEKISLGTNNLVYKARLSNQYFAIKISSKKNLYRMKREALALHLVKSTFPGIAPTPLYLTKELSNSIILVQEWLEGTAFRAAPQEEDIEKIIKYYAEIHKISPSLVNSYISKSKKLLSSKKILRRDIYNQLRYLSENDIPDELHDVLKKWEKFLLGFKATNHLAFCRGDGNFTNFLKRPYGIGAVDWEYSGWGDPLYDLINFLAHPAYIHLSLIEIMDYIEYYRNVSEEQFAVDQVKMLLLTTCVYWAARYINLLKTTDPKKEYLWRDRPSLRIQNYQRFIQRSELLFRDYI